LAISKSDYLLRGTNTKWQITPDSQASWELDQSLYTASIFSSDLFLQLESGMD